MAVVMGVKWCAGDTGDCHGSKDLHITSLLLIFRSNICHSTFIMLPLYEVYSSL
jgi:hypothetical protein